jgi:hypothetical protein
VDRDEALQDSHCLMLAIASSGYGSTILNLPSDKMHRPLVTPMPITRQ